MFSSPKKKDPINKNVVDSKKKKRKYEFNYHLADTQSPRSCNWGITADNSARTNSGWYASIQKPKKKKIKK